MREIIGYGGKKGDGGGGVEAPDSLHSISYAKVLDLVSEGEIQGLANGMKSVFFNETPLQNADGTYNFQGATIDFRAGTQIQDPIDGFPDVSTEIPVGVEFRSTSPWTKAISNTQLTSISVRLGINALSKADTSNGNINGYSVAYKIELSTDGGAYQTMVDTSFSGKTSSQYQRSHRIKLPKANTGWSVRVSRSTPNANSSTVADSTTVLTYTELIDARMRYPMSALVGIQIDASQFQNIPTRAYDLYGRILQVPSNYDPTARTYSGIWDGTFKPAWTNNPAWVFYDLLTNSRYGLGNLIPSSYVDKWGLYRIAQYCDQMVPDGKGGTEPRFTCNLYLQTAAEAYKVLQDLAALFRGITYWAGGTIVAAADMPQDPTYIFTAANVIDGKFHNTGSSKKTRYTVAVVSWNDPANFYKPKAEYVQDDDGLIRYGVQQLNITAFGCTSQGQAQRAGKWALLTSRLETDVVTFSVALDALQVSPGQIVRIANPNKAGRRNGGRIHSAVGRVVTLDKAPVIAAGDKLSVMLPTGVSETKTVTSVSGNDVNVSSDWSVLPQAHAVWSVDSANLVAPTYRIVSITQKDSFTYEISAIRNEQGKYAAIDTGTTIEQIPTTIQTAAPAVPTNLMFSSTPYWVDDSVSAINGILSWSCNAPNYLVSWRRGDDLWANQNVTTPSFDIKAMQPGDYSFKVMAVSSTGLKSQAATYTATVTPQLPPLPAVTGLALESAFTTNSAKLKWNSVTGATSYKMSVVANGVTVRTVKLGNSLRYEYSTADMKADGGPWRTVSFNVQAFGKFGTQSPVATITASNPQIGALTNMRIDAGIKTGFFKCTPPGDDDFAGIIVWVSTEPTCPAIDGNRVYDGPDTFVTISKLGDGVTALAGDQVYYVRASAYDTFGKDNLAISSAVAFTASANAPDANSITAAMIKSGVLDMTKFASGLQPVGMVNGLPNPAGYAGPTVVTNSVDGKLYRLVGGVWTAEVKTTDLSGQLTDAQIAAISAAKIAGQITQTQISPNSIGTPQLQAGAVKAAQIDAGAITASKLAVIPRSISPDPFFDAGGAMWTNLVAQANASNPSVPPGCPGRSAALFNNRDSAGFLVDVSPGEMYKVAIWVNNLGSGVSAGWVSTCYAPDGTMLPIFPVGRTLSGGWQQVISTLTVPAGVYRMRFGAHIDQPWGGSQQVWFSDFQLFKISDSTLIQDGAITTPKLTAAAVTADKMAANSVTTAALQAGAVKAAQIDAGAVTAAKLFVQAAGSALNRDPNFTDTTAWTIDINGSGAGPEWPFSTNATGASANTCVYVRNLVGAGSAEVWMYENTVIPLDPGRTYRLAGNFYSDPGNGRRAYLGLLFYDSNGIRVGTTWGGLWDGYPWTDFPAPGRFTQYAGIFGAGTANAIPANVTQCRIGVILNYGGGGNNGRMAAQSIRLEEVLPGTLIQDGAITTPKLTAASVTGDKVAANTLTAANILANSITGDRLQVGSVSANIFSSGIAGNNLLENSAFAATYVAGGVVKADGYADSVNGGISAGEITVGVNLIGDDYHPAGIGGLVIRQLGTSGQGQADPYVGVVSPIVPAAAGQWVEASFYSGAYRCVAYGYLGFYDVSGNALGYTRFVDNTGVPAGRSLASFYRHALVAQAPAGTVCCRILFRKRPTSPGYSDSYMMIQCPMIAAAMSGNQTAPSPWSPPGLGTQINGGIIKTGTVMAQHLAAGSISADKLASRELSAMFATIGTMRTATSGARTEISDNVIKVFDPNGTLRVKIGNLLL